MKSFLFVIIFACSFSAMADYLDRVFFSMPSQCNVTEATGEFEVFKGSTVDYAEAAGAKTSLLTITSKKGKASYQLDVVSRISTSGLTESKAQLPGVKNERFIKANVESKGWQPLKGKVFSYMPAYPNDPKYQGTLTFECK